MRGRDDSKDETATGPDGPVCIDLPWGKSLEIEPVAHGDGELLHLLIREGRRLTTLELDRETAERWANAMLEWTRAG